MNKSLKIFMMHRLILKKLKLNSKNLIQVDNQLQRAKKSLSLTTKVKLYQKRKETKRIRIKSKMLIKRWRSYSKKSINLYKICKINKFYWMLKTMSRMKIIMQMVCTEQDQRTEIRKSSWWSLKKTNRKILVTDSDYILYKFIFRH